MLRELNISFYAYSPLAGGFLSKSARQVMGDMHGRWDRNTEVGKLYHRLYNKPSLVQALEAWERLARKAQTTKAALAYRWVVHHSALKSDKGDAVLIGTSGIKQLEETLGFCTDGPLPEIILPEIDKIWQMVKEEAPVDNYYG